MPTPYFRERARNPYLRTPIGYDDDQDAAMYPPATPTFDRPMSPAPEVIERPPVRLPVYPGPPTTAVPMSPAPSLEALRTGPPVLPYPRPRPMTAPPAPTGPTAMPGSARPSRAEELKEAESVYMKGTPGRGKSAMRTAVHGLFAGLAGGGGLGGAAGGAIAGAAYGALDPRGARELEFRQKVRPKMMEGYALEDQDRQRGYQQTLEDAALARIPREAELHQATLRHMETQDRVSMENAKASAQLRESQVKLNLAKAEAERTGKPQKVDRVNVETGQIETVMVYPNRAEFVVGGSAPAAISAARNQSAERRVDVQQAGATGRAAMAQSGATGRTAMTQAGQDKRQEKRLAAQAEAVAGGGSKLRNPNRSTDTASNDDKVQKIMAEAKKRGKVITEEQIRARLKARGQ